MISSLPFGESLLRAPVPSIKFVLEGEEEYVVDGRSQVVNAGQFMLLATGEDCMARVRRGGGRTQGMCVYLACDALEADFSGGRALMLSAKADPLGEFLGRQAARLAANPTAGADCAEAIVATAGRMAAHSVRAAELRMANLGASKVGTRANLLTRLERARSFLHENVDRRISQTELAKVAGLSQFHMVRQFQEVFGMAPGAYHRDLRLSLARRMVGEGATLEVAAEQTGYADANTLSHALRRAAS